MSDLEINNLSENLTDLTLEDEDNFKIKDINGSMYILNIKIVEDNWIYLSIISLPLILQEIVLFLKTENIKCHKNVEGEGRIGSAMDEKMIKKILMKKFPENTIDQRARKFGDILIKDYNGVICPVNIKTSLGGSDNCFSRGGFVFALTDLNIDQIPGSMNLKIFKKLIDENRCDVPIKDYWFLCVDKKTSDVMIRGTKQIKHWKVNPHPSNTLQVDWAKEKQCEPVLRTGEEAYNFLIENGVKKSLIQFQNNLPNEWKI